MDACQRILLQLVAHRPSRVLQPRGDSREAQGGRQASLDGVDLGVDVVRGHQPPRSGLGQGRLDLRGGLSRRVPRPKGVHLLRQTPQVDTVQEVRRHRLLVRHSLSSQRPDRGAISRRCRWRYTSKVLKLLSVVIFTN